MKVTFVKKQGRLPEALGVASEKMLDLDSFVNNLIIEGNSLIQVIEEVQEAFDLDENEFSAFMYALGYYMAKSGN